MERLCKRITLSWSLLLSILRTIPLSFYFLNIASGKINVEVKTNHHDMNVPQNMALCGGTHRLPVREGTWKVKERQQASQGCYIPSPHTSTEEWAGYRRSPLAFPEGQHKASDLQMVQFSERKWATENLVVWTSE